MTAYPLGLCSNPFDWFDSIQVINLPTRSDRLMECRQEFKRVGLKKYTVVSPEFNPKPEMSLLLTNLKILLQARCEKVERLLILEDDVQFTQTAKSDLLTVINEIHYNDWKMIYLGATVKHCLMKAYPHLLRLNFGFSNHAIAYHCSVFDAAITVLEAYAKQYIKPIDRVYLEFIQPTMEVYLCNPMVAIHRGSYSDIEHNHVNYPMQKEFERANK